MDKATKKLTADFPAFEREQIDYYKKHPGEVSILIKAVLDDFNKDETFDEDTFMKVLLKIAKIKGVTRIAEKAKVKRESIYQYLGNNANPSFKTFKNITSSLGIKMRFNYCGK
jgi:probable addiction module antidote protein